MENKNLKKRYSWFWIKGIFCISHVITGMTTGLLKNEILVYVNMDVLWK